MKMTKKKVFAVALSVCLVAIISMGTLAWFTDTDRVDNIFNVTTSDQTGDADFSIELFETEVIPATGAHGDGDGDGTIEEVKGNTYNNLVPNATLAKDPTVRNTGSYDQWVRVKVTFTDYLTWCAVMGNNYDCTETLIGIDATKWTKDTAVEVAANGDSVTYTYYLNTKLVADATETLFTNVKIPSDFEVDTIFAQFELDLVAEAVQADYTGTTAQEAFALVMP